MSKEKESIIIQNIRSGKDDDALRFLYKTTLPKIKGMVSKYGGTLEDAKDVFQDGVVILYRKIKKRELEPNSNPEAFLFSVCRNIWLNKMKRDTRIKYPEFLPEIIDNQSDVSLNFEMKEQQTQIELVFDKLGEKCSQLLKLLFIQHFNTEDIVKEMNFSSTDVVKTTKNRCKNKLHELLLEHPHLKKALSGQA